MAEYIDREALIKDIGDSVRFSSRNGVSAEMRGAHKIVDRIFSAPIADVVEVVHGKWEKEKWTDTYQHICSVCSATSRVHPQSCEYKYCPYCGAKMDGDENG